LNVCKIKKFIVCKLFFCCVNGSWGQERSWACKTWTNCAEVGQLLVVVVVLRSSDVF